MAALRIDSADRRSRVNESALDAAIAQVLVDAGRGKIADVYEAISDCMVRKVRDDGSIAVPWIWDYELGIDESAEAALRLLSEDFKGNWRTPIRSSNTIQPRGISWSSKRAALCSIE